MHPEFVKSVVQRLETIATKGKAVKDAPNRYWGPWGKVDLSFELDEELQGMIRELMKRSGCEKTHSFKVVQRAMIEFYGRLANLKVENAVGELTSLFQSYEGYSEMHAAHLILDGVRIFEELKLGNVDIFHCTNEKFDEMLRLGQFELKESNDKSKEEVEAYTGELREKLVGKALMRYEVRAEPVKANELAIEESMRVIDLLRYAARSIEHENFRIGFEGENNGTPNFVLSKNFMGSFPNTSKNFRLDGEALELMRVLGVFELSELILKPVTSLTEIEDSILTAVRWFASAVNQTEENVSFLHFVICLESLFTSVDKSLPISSTIADSVAFLCADSKLKRVKIKREIKELYDLRSTIAHGGKHTVPGQQLDRVALAAQASIKKILEHRDQLNTKIDLAAYIDDLRYFGRADAD